MQVWSNFQTKPLIPRNIPLMCLITHRSFICWGNQTSDLWDLRPSSAPLTPFRHPHSLRPGPRGQQAGRDQRNHIAVPDPRRRPGITHLFYILHTIRGQLSFWAAPFFIVSCEVPVSRVFLCFRVSCISRVPMGSSPAPLSDIRLPERQQTFGGGRILHVFHKLLWMCTL